MSRCILDTSAIIDIWSGDVVIDDLPPDQRITIISVGELAAGVGAARSSAELTERAALYASVVDDFERVGLPYDLPAVQTFGEVWNDASRSGRAPRRRTADLMIAAIAIRHQIPLITSNVDDFAHIRWLDVRPTPTTRSNP